MSARILIVDDDTQVREVLRRFLEAEGYEVLEAASAEQAVQMVEALPPAVAFCDIHMAGANGLWLADQIRAIVCGTTRAWRTANQAMSVGGGRQSAARNRGASAGSERDGRCGSRPL